MTATPTPRAVAARSMVAREPKLPALTEAEWQRQVTDLAELYGWQWAHFRPAQTSRGWRTPVSGPLGAGFPDLVMVRVRDKRLLFVELKAAGRQATLEQSAVLEALSAAAECYVWRPSDFDRVQEELR